MIAWLEGIFTTLNDFFSAAWDFISMIVEKIIDFFHLVGEALSFVWTAVQLLPTVYIAFGIAMIIVLLVMVILGRESGGD